MLQIIPVEKARGWDCYKVKNTLIKHVRSKFRVVNSRWWRFIYIFLKANHTDVGRNRFFKDLFSIAEGWNYSIELTEIWESLNLQ